MFATDPTPPEPRRFSIRLPRPLWIGVAALVLIVVAFGFRIGAKAYRQNVVLREFDRLHVLYDTRPSGPQWLRESLLRCGCSPELLPQEVCSVRVGYDVSPLEFNYNWFSSLPSLNDLHVDASWFGPTDLHFLNELPELRELSLRGVQLSDDAMRSVSRLRHLQILDLSGTSVSDEGLGHLKSLKELQSLLLCNTQVTEDGVKDLQNSLREALISRECPGS